MVIRLRSTPLPYHIRMFNESTKMPYHVCEIFDSADDSYELYNDLLKEVVDSHVPLKRGVVKTNPVII